MGSTVNTMSEHDMHLLDSAPFGRILPAMVTPMQSDGSVDFAAAQKLAKYLVADGADGLVVNGTTGESPVTHMDEKVELVRAVKEVVDVPVISGAGSNDTAHTVRMVEQTQEAGADAVLVVMPYYSRPSQDGIVGHYKAVDESAEKPIIVYDVPGRTGLKVKVGTYDRLAELEHVKAVKDATGDLAAAVEKQQRTGLAWSRALSPPPPCVCRTSVPTPLSLTRLKRACALPDCCKPETLHTGCQPAAPA